MLNSISENSNFPAGTSSLLAGPVFTKLCTDARFFSFTWTPLKHQIQL